MSGGAAALEPKVTEADRAGGGAVETLRASRLDFLFRSKPAGRAPSQAQNADAALASESRSATTAEQEPQPASVGPVQDRPEQAASEPEHQAEAASVAETAPSATILKSGIVDGMAYTLYADGSIEAALPDGTVRFGSIAELRAHIESNS
jgi:hypothetical protein